VNVLSATIFKQLDKRYDNNITWFREVRLEFNRLSKQYPDNKTYNDYKETIKKVKARRELQRIQGIKLLRKNLNKRILKVLHPPQSNESINFKPKEYRNRNSYLIKTYGVTVNDYLIMLKDQNYQCAICSTPDPTPKKYFSVDHCHKTDKVRGLLCNTCNTGLGMFRDNELSLFKARNYLIQAKLKI